MKFPDFVIREDLDPYALSPAKETLASLDGMEAESALGRLAQKARSGDGKALWAFASIACKVTEALSQMTKTHPEAFAPIARKMNRWPQMRSKHPLLCDAKQTLEDIELGQDVPLLLDKYSKWKADHASDVAIQLLKHLESMRDVDCLLKFANKKVRASKYLGSFNKESALKWWGLAEGTLKGCCPQPEQHWKLKQIATTKSRTSPGRMREQIFTKIKARFIAFAPL